MSQRAEDCGSGAHERRGVRRGDAVRDGHHEPGIGTHEVGPAAVTAYDSPFFLGAEMFFPRGAPLTSAARTRLPAETDTLPDRKTANAAAECRHGPDNFVTRNDGIARHVPLVVDHGEIRVADSAMRHFDLDLAIAEWPDLIGHYFQRLAAAPSRVAVDDRCSDACRTPFQSSTGSHDQPPWYPYFFQFVRTRSWVSCGYPLVNEERLGVCRH